MGLNGVLPASLVGRAVPLVFALAVLGVLAVSYGFIRLTSHFNHAGSVYALVGATLGPRAGFFSGWALFGTYLTFTAATIPSAGLFGEAFLRSTGIWAGADWLPIALVATAGVWLLAYREIRVASRSLWTMEGISVATILVLIVVVFFRLFTGTAPREQTFTLAVFTPPEGVSWGAVVGATAYGFLSWAGFEGAASLGEETNDPRRNVPRAIAIAVALTAVFYVVTMMMESLGFGVDRRGVAAFAGSSSPLGDLAAGYVGALLSDLLNFGAMVSSFAAALGCATAASRNLFAFARDGFVSRRLGVASPRTGAPANALALLMVTVTTIYLGLRLVGVDNAIDHYYYMATLGVLSLLVAYMLTSVGAIVFLPVRTRSAPLWEAVVPAAAVVYLLYTLYKNATLVPTPPYSLFPFVVGAWLLVGAAVVVLVPGLAQRIGENLTREEGLDAADREGA
ncbi:amino acid permease [soil metagenome]